MIVKAFKDIFLFENYYVSLFFLCMCSQEADTDDQQGTLTFEEFTVFYKMMSLRRDLYLLLMCFSEKKDHLTAEELGNFLHVEQKVSVISVPDQNLWPLTFNIVSLLIYHIYMSFSSGMETSIYVKFQYTCSSDHV